MNYQVSTLFQLLIALNVLVCGCAQHEPRVEQIGEGRIRTDTARTMAVEAVDTSFPADPGTLPTRDHSQWRPRMPMVRLGACPGESCYYGYPVVACQELALRASDAFDAQEILAFAKGDTATLVTGNLHLTEPGIVLIKRDHAITDIELYEEMDGKSSVPAKDTLRFFAGDTLYVLDYVELGSWNWWYRGKASAGDEFWSGPLQRSSGGREPFPAISVSEPRGEWWYKLRLQSGSEGWVRTAGEGWWKDKTFVKADGIDWKC